MSTYHEVIAKVFGTPESLRRLEAMARDAEDRANIRAEEFEVTELATGVLDTSAAVYKSGLSRFWPVLRSFLRSEALAPLDVFVYVVGYHECYSVYAECYYGGVRVASDGPLDGESDDFARRAFVKHAAKFGTHPAMWQVRALIRRELLGAEAAEAVYRKA
jgi:hypothetical protein